MWENWMENNNHNQGPFFCLSSTYTQASENVTWYSMHTTYNSFSWTFIAPCSLFSYSLSIALQLIFIHPVLTGPKIRSLLQLWKLNHHVFSKYSGWGEGWTAVLKSNFALTTVEQFQIAFIYDTYSTL